MTPENEDLGRLVAASAAAVPERIGFTYLHDGEELNCTLAELHRRAMSIAAQVRSSLDIHERVLVLFPPGIEFVTAFLGCIYARVTPVIFPLPLGEISLGDNAAGVRSAIKQVHPAAIITQTSVQAIFSQAMSVGSDRPLWIVPESFGSWETGTESIYPQVASEPASIIQFSIGTGGQARAALIDQSSLLRAALEVGDLLELSTINDGLCCEHPASHTGLFWGVLLPLVHSYRGIFLRAAQVMKNPLTWLQTISDFRVSIAGGSEGLYRSCVYQHQREPLSDVDLSHWRQAYVSYGSALSPSVADFGNTFSAFGFHHDSLYAAYQLAEVAGPVSLARPSARRINADIGDLAGDGLSGTTASETPPIQVQGAKILSEIEVDIIEPSQSAPSEGRIFGQLAISGARVARTFCADEAFGRHSGLIATPRGAALCPGDVGMVDQGELFLAGRSDDVMVIRGKRYLRSQIEGDVECCHPRVRAQGGALFTVDVEGRACVVFAQEVERRSPAKRRTAVRRSRKQSRIPERRKIGSRRRRLGERRLLEPADTNYRTDAPFDPDDILQQIRSTLSQRGIDPNVIVLLKAGTIPRTTAGTVQRWAVREHFVGDTLNIVGEWRAPALPVKLVSRDQERVAEILRPHIAKQVAQVLEVPTDTIDTSCPLMDLGLTSAKAALLDLGIRNLLGTDYARQASITATMVFSYPTVDGLAQYLASRLSKLVEPENGEGSIVREGETQESTPAGEEPHPIATSHEVGATFQQESTSSPIAVVGMACRLPGASSPEEFWELLRSGREAISEIPKERWRLERYYNSQRGVPGRMYTKRAGFIGDVDKFDGTFFGIKPAEAAAMDPQQRLLLEVSWEALERAGHASDSIAGRRCGVFVGIQMSEYGSSAFHPNRVEDLSPFSLTGSALNIASGRISHTFDLRGPSISVDTACSSSLLSLHLACKSILSGDCEMALAGGANLILSPEVMVSLCRMNALAPDGRCKTFDASANGYVRAEGCAMIVLKRLEQAEHDGDNVLATIVGSSVGQDGRSTALTAPNGLAQESVLSHALQKAQLSSEAISFVETHGTGTVLGDPIELQAIQNVLGKGRESASRLALGAVKGNIGHLESGAGVAGVIKTILCLKNEELPPNIQLTRLNPHISLASNPVTMPKSSIPWASSQGRLRSAGVSSFGFSGTNVHLILQEAPHVERPTSIGDRPAHVLSLSAKTPEALRRRRTDIEAYLLENPRVPFADVCFSANARRNFKERIAISAGSGAEALRKLRGLHEGVRATGVAIGTSSSRPRLCMAFSGHGSQYVGMGRELYATSPRFRHTLDSCNDLTRDKLEESILDVMFGRVSGAAELLNQTVYTQPILFSLEYALADLWICWGLKPDIVLGHSVGELVAACVAGAMRFQDGLLLASTRGRLLQRLPQGGGMAVLVATVDQAEEAIAPHAGRLVIAGINSATQVTISGDLDAIDQVIASLREVGIRGHKLGVPHAFHSHLVEPILADFASEAEKIEYGRPNIGMISNANGAFVEEALSASYWVQHVRQPILLSKGLQLARESSDLILEVGPQPILMNLEVPGVRNQPTWRASLRRGRSDWEQMSETLAEAYVKGSPVNWASFDQGYGRRHVALPAYPFAKTRHWLADRSRGSAGAFQRMSHPLVQSKLIMNHDGLAIFESVWSSDFEPICDHIVYGKVIVPAAAMLESILASALELMERRGGLAIQGALFREAFILAQGEERRMRVVLRLTGDSQYEAKLLSASANLGDKEEWILHVEGQVVVDPGNKQIDLHPTEAACIEEQPGSEYFDDNLGKRGLQLKHGFRWISSVRRRDGEALFGLRPPDSADETSGFWLHPGIMDSGYVGTYASMASSWVHADAKDLYLPLSVEHYRFIRRPPRGPLRTLVRARRPGAGVETETNLFDFEIVDQEGHVAAELRGVSMKHAKPSLFAEESPISRLLHWPTWQSSTFVDNHIEGQDWLVLAYDKVAGEKLTSRLQARGNTCSLAIIGANDQASHLAALDRHLGNDRDGELGIIYLCESADMNNRRTTDSVLLQVHTLLETVKHVAKSAYAGRLFLVTRGAQMLEADTSISSSQTTLWGVGRVAAIEHGDIWGACIDLPEGPMDDGNIETLAGLVTTDTTEQHLAVREGAVLVARLDNYSAMETHPIAIHSDRTYLITGGLGFIGLQVARWLIDKGARHLALLSRRTIGPELHEQLDALKLGDVSLNTIRCDVTQQDQLSAALGQIRQSQAPLAGVIHAAGSLSDGLILNQDLEALRKVFQPKIAGLLNLELLLEGTDLDFLALFSSATSMLGLASQAGYAAANAFLDAEAHRLRARGVPAVSINWGPWGGGGMALSYGEKGLRQFDHWGMSLISPEQALAALQLTLAQEQPQIGIFDIEWPVFSAAVLGSENAPYLSKVSRGTKKSAQVQRASPAPRASSDAKNRLGSLSPAKRRKQLLAEISDLIKSSIGSDSDLQPAKPLMDMGVDSLMALNLRDELSKLFGERLPPTLIFDYPTLDNLTDYLMECLGLNAAEDDVIEHLDVEADDDDFERMLTAVEGMTVEAAKTAVGM